MLSAVWRFKQQSAFVSISYYFVAKWSILMKSCVAYSSNSRMHAVQSVDM